MRNFSGNKRQCGVALILVLWILVILTIMAASFSLSLRRETELVRNALARAEAIALAEGGVYHAMLMLLPDDPMRRWRADGTIYEFGLDSARIRVQIYDEAGKIDLNGAQEELLLGAVVRAGLSREEASAVIDAILDWRDRDDLRRLNGAEADDYKDAGYSYGPRNKPFQTLEELQLVKGVTAALYQALEPLLTLSSRQQGLDPAKAPREALLAIPGANEEIVDQYLASRAQSERDKAPPPEFPIPLGGLRAGREGAAYSVLAEAWLETGERARLQVLIRRGGGELPFGIAGWKRPNPLVPSLFQEASS